MDTMGIWETLRVGAIAGLFVSLFGIPFTLALSVVYALALKLEGTRWMIPATRHKPARPVPFLRIAILGGIGGDFAAVNTLSIGEWWICRTQHRLCNDGQGGMMLIFTVPILAIAGALIAWGWTWLTLRIPLHLPLASVFIFGGRFRWLNWLFALVVPVAFWALVTLVLIRATL